MDGQDYLNQISASARPMKQKSRASLLNSPIFKVAVIGVIAFVVIVVIGMTLTAGRKSVESEAVALKYHLDNTATVISTYQPSVKSSTLRSDSASLYSVITNTSRELTTYLTNKYNYKDGNNSYKNEASEAELNRDKLESDLMNAKINGILDQVYMSKIAYEISALASEEAAIYNSASDETLQSLLQTSYSSLETLLPYFSDTARD